MASQDVAETHSLQALAWLLQQDALLPVFLGASGLSEQDLRTRVSDPELLGAVLDFILMDDAWVVQACDALSLPYDALTAARAALPGGAQMHWT